MVAANACASVGACSCLAFAGIRFFPCCSPALRQKVSGHSKSGSVFNIGLLDLYQSRGAVDHAVSNIRQCGTNQLKRGNHVGLVCKKVFDTTHFIYEMRSKLKLLEAGCIFPDTSTL